MMMSMTVSMSSPKRPSAASPSSPPKRFEPLSRRMNGRSVKSKQPLKEAKAGDFASDKDVVALAKKWKVNAR